MKALVASLVLFVVSQVPAAAALNAYLTATGQKTGPIKGSMANAQIPTLNFACTSISNNELSTGKMVAGHRKWAPITITISDGAGATNIQNASNSKDPITISWWVSNYDQKPIFNVAFGGVNVTGIKTVIVGGKPQQQSTFTFITITWVTGGVTAHDSWNGSVGD